MKTAMEELIEYFKNNDSFYMYTKDDIIKLLEVYIEKEKEQIMEAFLEGKVNHNKDWSIEYYNKTYNQNK